MAIIYSYPLNTPKRDDLLIGTITYDEDAVNPVHGNPTVSFTVGSLLDLIAGQGVAQNLQQVTNIGNTTTNSIVISNNIKVSGGYYDSSNQPGAAGQLLSSTATGTQWVTSTSQGVTSVGLTMPAAFTVANSPITQAGVLTVTGAGTAAQYINGLGNLITFPTIPTQYVLPVATTVALGGVKIGYTSAGKNYAVQLSSEKAFVNVPWTDTSYTLPAATNAALGGIKIGYTSSGKNYAVQLDADSEGFVNVPWTDTPYTLPLAADGTRGGVQIGYTQASTRDYPVTLASEKMLVTVPWTDTQNADQTITGSGSGNTDSGITLSASGGTVLVLGAGSVTAAQSGNTITLTGINTWIANAVTIAGYVAAPAATDANLVWKTDANGNPAWRADADTDTGAVSISTAVNTTGTWTTPLVSGTIDASRNIQLTSNIYGGGAKVGFVPSGGTSTLYLKGDGSWGAIATGLDFRGVWDASGTDGGSPDLRLAANKGDGALWVVNVAGSSTPNGAGTTPNSWLIGDQAIYSIGTSLWSKVASTNTGVTSMTTTDGTYIDLTPNAATTGAVTVTADLSAANGTSDTSTRFLSKDNTWDIPSYTTDENTTYTVDVPTSTTSINLKGSDGTDDAIVLTGGTNVTLTRTDANTIDIAATNTNTQNEYASSWIQSTNDILLRLTESGAGSGTQDIKIVKGANITFTYTDANNFTIAATDTNTEYTAGTGLTLTGTVFSADVDATQADDDTVALSAIADRFYGVQLDNDTTVADAKLVVNVPWVDTNTTYNAMTTSVLGLGKIRYDFGETPAAEDQSITADRTYGVTKNASDQLVVNVPWLSGGTYSWTVKDSTTGSSAVASSESIQFVTATGNLGTTLTEPTTGEFLMTLTSPNTMGSGFTVSADTNTAATTITQGNTLTLSGGTNVATVSDPDGTITINATDTNTLYELTSGTDTTLNLFSNPVIATAQSASAAGSNTSITYDNETPAGGIVNGQYATGVGIPVGTRVVSHTALGITFNQLVNVANNAVISFRDVDTVAFTAGSNVTLTGTSNEIEIAATNSNTTYDFLTVATGGTNVNPALRLDPSTGSNDDIVLTGSGGTTITRTSNTGITIDSDNDNDTYTLSSGNTKVITLTKTSVSPNVSAGTITFVDGSDISISSAANNEITIASTFAESDTLATVTARGATTSTASTFSGGLTANPASNNNPAITTNSALGSIISLGRNALPTNGNRLGKFEFNGYNNAGGNPVVSANIFAAATIDWVNANNYDSEITFQTTVGTVLRSSLTAKAGLLKVWGTGALGGDAKIILNCYVNSHGQTLSAQPHSAGVTNTMLLPKGASSTLVSEATFRLIEVIVTVSGSKFYLNCNMINDFCISRLSALYSLQSFSTASCYMRHALASYHNPHSLSLH